MGRKNKKNKGKGAHFIICYSILAHSTHTSRDGHSTTTAAQLDRQSNNEENRDEGRAATSLIAAPVEETGKTLLNLILSSIMDKERHTRHLAATRRQDRRQG